MLKLARSAAVLLACMLLGSGALGQGTEDRLRLARALAAQSGLDFQSRQLDGHMTGALEQHRQGLPPPVYAALRDAAGRAFDGAQIAEAVVRAVSQALPEGTLREAMAWYAAPLGEKITNAEVAASGPLAAAMVPEYAKYLKANPPSKRRLELANQLLDVTHAMDYAAGIAEAVAVGTTLGLSPLMPPEKRPKEADLRRTFRAEFAKAGKSVRETMVVSALYAYGSVSEADLAAYVKFLRSPAGSKYQDAATRAVAAEIARRSLEMARFAAEALVAQQGRKQR